MRKTLRALLVRGLRHFWETEVIGQEECPMMLRWTLFTIGPHDEPWFKFLIHYFPPNVSDRDPHDHPRSFITLILRGGYFNTEWEDYGGVVAPTIEYLEAGALKYRPAKHMHIVETGDKAAWTFVVMGPLQREWGFLRDGTWLHFRTYIDRFGGVIRCDTDE